MLDEEGKKTFFQQIHSLWIKPELDKRFPNGIPNGFQIREALIKLPHIGLPVVEFNREIQWLFKFQSPQNVEVDYYQEIYLHEIESIEQALPPQIDGKRVAFVYLFWSGYSYSVIFDFSPNDPDFDPNEEFMLGLSVSSHFRAKMAETTVRLSANAASELRQIGLWVVASLTPYPLSKIIERIGANQLDEARAVLVEYCKPDFIDRLIETWFPIHIYRERIDIFREAAFAHRNGKYISSIYTLVPQIEGIITDWLYPIVQPQGTLYDWKMKKRINDFERLIQQVPQFEYQYREALRSTLEFLRDGQPLQGFTSWLDKIDPNFPARHPLAHGKLDKTMFNEENSIKLFLFLDTICQFMMFYEVRKLGKDLGMG